MYVFLLVASLALFVAVCVVYARQSFASVYHPSTLYLAFHGLVFVVRPIAAYYYGYDFLYRGYEFNPPPDVKATVIVAANIGLLAFLAGSWRAGGAPMVFLQQTADVVHRRTLLSPFVVVLALLGPIALASLITIYTSGYAGMQLDTNTGVAINTTGNGWLYEAQLMLVPLSVLVAWLFRFRWWSLLPLIAFVVIRAGTGGRGPFVIACVAAALLWLFDKRRKWPSPRLALLAVALFAGFYTLGQARGLVRETLDTGTVSEFRADRGVLETMDFANLEFFEFIVNTVPRKTQSYGYFVDNLQLFTEPVPRKLWPGKPVGPPIRMFNLFDYGNPIGMTYSLPGYGWMQLGYFGVAIWCWLWGMALGAIYSRFARGRQDNFMVAAYFAFLPIFVVAFRDGGVVTIARTAVFYLTPVLVWLLAARAMGVAVPRYVPQRRAPRARQPAAPTDAMSDAIAPRSRRRAETIVPRAWRGRAGTEWPG